MTAANGPDAGVLLQLATQAGVTWAGRRVRIEETPWLAGPIGPVSGGMGAEVFEEYAAVSGFVAVAGEERAGLVADFAALGSGGFDPDEVSSGVRSFYERTALYSLDASVLWEALVGLVPRAAVHLIGRRGGQYDLPTASRSSEIALTNEVIRLLDPETGEARCAGWLRRSTLTGRTVLAGLYSACELPGREGRFLKGVYPLPGGSATVILRPENRPDGAFALISDALRFGGPGYYRLHDSRRGLRALCPPIRQVIGLWEAGSEGEVGVEHVFQFAGLRFLRLGYRISHRDGSRARLEGTVYK